MYHFPRYAVVPGHAHKAFVPYTRLLSQHDPASSSSASSSSSPPSSSSSEAKVNGLNGTAAEEEVDDPDRFVSAVSGLKASLEAANSAALSESQPQSRSSSRPRQPAPPKHLVVQASVESIGRGYVDLDRPISLPSVVAPSSVSPSASADPVVLGSADEDKAPGCGEPGCCSGDRDCYERDSGYAGSLIEEKLASLASSSGSFGIAEGDARRRNGSSGSSASRRGRGSVDQGKVEGTGETKRIHWDFLIYVRLVVKPSALFSSADNISAACGRAGPRLAPSAAASAPDPRRVRLGVAEGQEVRGRVPRLARQGDREGQEGRRHWRRSARDSMFVVPSRHHSSEERSVDLRGEQMRRTSPRCTLPTRRPPRRSP